MMIVCPGGVMKVSGTVNPVEGLDVTMILVVEVPVPPLPLEIVHVKPVTPRKFAVGVNVKPPCISKLRVPEAELEPFILQLCTLKTSLGPEISFARRPGALTVNGCPGGIV